MITGLASGIFWAIDTIILSIALNHSTFISTEQAIFLAPFVSTFLHDFFSSIWMLIYMGIRGRLKNVIRAAKTKSGRFIMLGALLGGPLGMTGYITSISYIGPGYAAIISSLYPAVGAVFARIFLKEKMTFIQMAGLAASLVGVIILGYTPDSAVNNLWIGIAFALLACFGWAAEAVICAYGMQDPDVSDEDALQIRQLTSVIFYGVIILNVVKGWTFTIEAFTSQATPIILLSSLFGTVSYLFYYRAIHRIGPTKATPLNITYSAWALIFSIIFLHTIPDTKSIICAIIIIIGAIVAGTDMSEILKKK